MYIETPGNRQSLTIVETISATGVALPPFLIVKGKLHMESWYHKNLTGDERVALSNTGYTNSEVAIKYLHHFIQHTNSTSSSSPKLLLMDSHISHEDPEFILLAHKHNIRPYTFPSHLTHILQPLDVTVFAVYKHWHKQAIHKAMRNLDLDYTIASFFRDLTAIRLETFKKGTIVKAFRESGMWKPSFKYIQKKLQVYAEPSLPAPLPHIEASQELSNWNEKFNVILSSPSRKRWQESFSTIKTQLIETSIIQVELSQITTQVLDQKKRSAQSKNSIQKGGVLTAQAAQDRIAAKLKKEQEDQENRERKAFNRLKRSEEEAEKRIGIEARKAERLQKKKVLLYQKSHPGQQVPANLSTPIPDPDAGKKKVKKDIKGKGRAEGDFLSFSDLDYSAILEGKDSSDGEDDVDEEEDDEVRLFL